MVSWLPLAYIDPGTGQAVLYAFAALGAGIAFRFRRLREWFSAKILRR